MPKILDNIETQTEEELLATLNTSYQFDAAIGYFNLRGWRLLADAIDALPPNSKGNSKARILVGIQESPKDEMRRLAQMREPKQPDIRSAAIKRTEVVSDYRHQLECGLPTIKDEAALQTLLRQIKSNDVDVRIHTAHRLHAKLYICHRKDTATPRVGYVGSSNLTAAGLREQGELNVDVVDVDATEKLANWFEDRWSDPFTTTAKLELAEAIEQSWASETQLDPYLVYLKMAYHLSREAREGLIEYGLPASMREKLLEFQAAAVKIAVRIIMQKGGAMIGDVVGLGKTLIGTAIARLLQEEEGFETLFVCPKNLTDMWESYRLEHKVHGKVESMSMIHKTLPEARRYRLVIVDEAHNFRNDTTRHHKALKEYISNNGSKALLLTATPYNKHLDDLYSELSLFIPPDADLGMRPELAIKEEGAAKFANKCEFGLSSLGAFKRSDQLGDWQDLMAQYLVRRTRRFVEDNYALTSVDGRKYVQFEGGECFYFPERVAEPIERRLAKDDPAAVMASDETLDSIRDLRLPRYRLGGYLSAPYRDSLKDGLTRKAKPQVEGFGVANVQLHVESHDHNGSRFPSASKTELSEELKLMDDLTAASRGTLEGFTRVSMFKRLSSSGPAFLKTLQRHLLRNLVAIYALEERVSYPVGAVSNAFWKTETDKELDDDAEEDEDTSTSADVATSKLFKADEENVAVAYAKLKDLNPKGTRWANPEMFTPDLLEDLHHDADVITAMLEKFGPWNPDLDKKADALEDLLANRYPTQKVLIFTEAADTAHYVAEELQRRGIEGVGVVTGDSDNPTALAHRFSPVSNPANSNGNAVREELRVLVSTDVLSEGQNLQDAHIIVNYDLPWAIVKLVQRAGRIDRIGQNAKKVVIHSMMPPATIEEEIGLRERIKRRLGENAKLLGSDEKFFGDPSEIGRMKEAYDGTLSSESEGAEDVDPVSMAYEIWRKATEGNPDLAKQVAALPNVVYSTKPLPQPKTEEEGGGVLVHSQTMTGADAFAFVGVDGEARRVTPHEALRLAECTPETSAVKRLPNHHDLTADALNGPLKASPQRATTALQGVRKKVWNRLHEQMSNLGSSLLIDIAKLKDAHDAINERPLYETATHTLAKAAKERSIEDLAELVVQLYEDGDLCVPLPQEETDSEPSIICTMGLR